MQSKKLIIFLLAAMAAVTAISCGSKVEPEGGAGSGTSGPEVPQPQPKPQLEGNIKGKVTDAVTGTPIEGVSVSDGYTVTYTDADGNYAIQGNELTRTVFISVPAEYEIPTDQNGHPTFYTNGPFNDTQKEYTVNFALTPRQKVSDKFLLCAAADVHIYDGTDKNYPQNRRSDLTKFKEDCLPDMIATMESLNSGGSYNDCLILFAGDQMSDNMDQVVPFKNALANKTVNNGHKLIFLHCIGNHDFANRDLKNKEATSYNASKTFVENFGPMDYSLNIGNAHIVVMNNMIVNAKDNWTRDNQVQCVGYGKGITNEQLEWLKQDLALVKNPEKKIIILCAHVPMFNGGQNYQEAVKLMGQFYEGHIISGHSHIIRNYVHKQTCKNGKGVYEHNLQSLAGDWWFSNLSSDGSPRGYKVFRFSGNKLLDSVNKTVGASANYQMRVYNGNDSYSDKTAGGGTPAKGTKPNKVTYSWGDDYKNHILVRVWNADENWAVSFVQDGVETPMTRLSSFVDQCSLAFGYNYQKEIYGAKFNTATDNFWAIEAPGGDPATETGWKVVATYKSPSGMSKKYECNILQRDYTGFATGDKFPENN